MKKMVQGVLVVLAALAVVTVAQAVVLYDTVDVSRDWKGQQSKLYARLRFMVQDQAQPGQSSIDQPLYLDLSLRLAAEAPLRTGEVETFRVSGRIVTGGTGSFHQIYVVVEPAVAYYDYETISGYVSASGGMSTAYASGKLVHKGHVRTGAAPAVGDPKVAYTTPAQPLTLSFADLAYDECGAVPTAYQFTFKKSTLFTTPPLVAKGEFPYVAGERQSVTIEKDGPFTQGAEAWFQDGSTYWVLIRFKRTGTEPYTDEFGAPFIARFTWKNGRAADLEVLPSVPTRDEVREQAFDRLHR